MKRILTSGIDYSITKPFNPREVVAQVRAALRRTAGACFWFTLPLAGPSLPAYEA